VELLDFLVLVVDTTLEGFELGEYGPCDIDQLSDGLRLVVTLGHVYRSQCPFEFAGQAVGGDLAIAKNPTNGSLVLVFLPLPIAFQPFVG
jgi:hypothetical protein